MTSASRYRGVLATVGLFTLAAGEFWRNLIGWWGWGALVLVLAVLMGREVLRHRPRFREIPVVLWAFLGLVVVSIAWSQYPSGSAVGIPATLLTALAGVYFATCLRASQLLVSASWALRAALGLSLVFEFVVAAIIRRPVLPLLSPIDVPADPPDAFYWSRALLFEGGRIQGIVGNANLIAMLALLGLVIFVAEWRDKRVHPVVGGFWSVVALVTLALSGSSTVILAGAVGAAATVLILILRHTRGQLRRAVWGVAIVGSVGSLATLFLARDWVFAILGRSPDLTNRVEIWSTVTGLAAQRPVFGWGWVSYWTPWVEPFDDLLVFNGVTYLQAHNAWIDVWFQLGTVGVLLFAGLVGGTAVRAWGVALWPPRHAGHGSSLVPAIVMTVLIVQSLAESRLLVELGFALLVTFAIRMRAARLERDVPLPRSPLRSGSGG